MRAHVKALLRSAFPEFGCVRMNELYVRARYAALYPTYLGDEFACPFCNKSFRRFLPYGSILPVLKDLRVVGAGYREHARCPRCESFDRERLVYLYLKHRTAVFHQPVRLLHVAPEKNLQRVLSTQPNISYLSVDIASPSAEIRMDITHLGLRDDTFDAVICNHVLQDVHDDRQALAELRRVLVPGGWAIVQVPLSAALNRTDEDPAVRSEEERARRYGGIYHIRLYGQDFAERLGEAGFEVRQYHYVEDFGLEDARRHGILVNEVLYIASKPGSGGAAPVGEGP